MSVWLIAFEKIDFKQIAQTNLGRPLNQGEKLFYLSMYCSIDDKNVWKLSDE